MLGPSSAITLAALLSFAARIPAAPTSPQSCNNVCTILHGEFADQTLLKNESQYTLEQSSFWSTIQGSASPKCFFSPKDAKDVSRAVLAAREGQCQFAVKSGGHYSFEASTIENGLVIDLARLNQTIVSDDKKTAVIGPGGRWSSVYPTLQEQNLTVPGGRMFGVGVGGLSLGGKFSRILASGYGELTFAGGVSWLSNLHGMTCDNVLEYEVVMADGSIVTATPTTRKDLYWALRGGGSNFGIVTKFTFNAYEQGKLWNSQLKYDSTANTSSIKTFVDWGNDLVATDPKSFSVLLWDYNTDGPPTGTAILTHADTFSDNKHPQVFDGFYGANPSNITESNAYHAEIADGLVFPGGVTRNSFWTTSFELDAAMMQQAFEIWHEESKATASLATQQLQLQIFTAAEFEFAKRNGGNPTSFANQKRPLGFLNIIVMWAKAEDDKVVYATQQRIEDRVNAAAKERGLYNEFKYTNYASQFQDPFTSYGPKNKARLLEVAKAYDPDGVFQKLVSGGFKLTRGPEHL
ncbi:6-hydroxy-d-nicotine oxidase [Colletotrichum musicola]|uniref:6-hydroxy-d-nicotine oxidase n=1 Tax=Colletotrichum musicola TaxID=2175873 RepID=A0A8H6KMN8_9PEZI|nr:6-hydroxy-d-nicotine oxidase [Colletotrichum musicola]